MRNRVWFSSKTEEEKPIGNLLVQLVKALRLLRIKFRSSVISGLHLSDIKRPVRGKRSVSKHYSLFEFFDGIVYKLCLRLVLQFFNQEELWSLPPNSVCLLTVIYDVVFVSNELYC